MHKTTERPAPAGSGEQQVGVRVGPLLGIAEVLAERGVDLARVLASAGLDGHIFDDAENRLSTEALGRLFQTCASLSGCAHIAMLVGHRFRLASLGELGLLMKHSATAGQACRHLVSHMHLQDRLGVPLLFSPMPDCVALGYSIREYHVVASEMIQDGTLAIFCQLMLELCGPGWKPQRVQFAHGKPQDIHAYREIFNAPLQFDAEFSAIIFPSRWLESPLPEAHPELHELLFARLLKWQHLLDPGVTDKVRRSLQVMVISGTASAQGVAAQLGCSERTLRRQLQAEGYSFQGLLNECLCSLAKQLIEETALSMSAIASALHYRDLATFSSAFRRWTGSSPTRWRAARLLH